MFRSSSSFDRLLEKATSNLLLEPDWVSIMAICDAIRSGETGAKYAVSAIKKKFYHENPHVVMFALQVMESCVKNCGSIVHDEIATKTFMEEVREMIKHSKEENVKAKLLELLQTWGMAFRSNQKYRIVTDTLNLMKAEGWSFPPVREAEAMYEADNAPDWAEGEVCHRCRVEFGLVTRQHHCRACGQVFCGKCSAKTSTLPKFGIEREVRVCDSCFELYGPKEGAGAGTAGAAVAAGGAGKRGIRVRGADGVEQIVLENDLPEEYLASSLAQQSRAPPAAKAGTGGSGGKTEAELKEEEELQLAIALSQSEAQAKEDAKRRGGASYSSPKFNPEAKSESSGVKAVSAEKGDPDGELAPELMRYLDRDYWEQKEREKADSKKQDFGAGKAAVTAAVGGGPSSSSFAPTAMIQPDQPALSAAAALAAPIVTQNLPPALAGGATDPELDEFVTTLKTQVEIFVNRMKSNSSRGRSITNDSSVQTLFMNTMAMHSKLLKHIQDQEDKRVYYEGLQDKIAQVKDARAALDALREEERERKRREAEEAERLRQIQMREKLEVMRKKKQEYLQYQRQVALQRMHEQEREMKLRQEQAMQQVQANRMPMYNNMMMQQQPGYPGVGQPQPGQPAPGMPPMGYPGMPGGQPPYMHYQPYPMGPSGPVQGNAGMHGGPPPQNGDPAFNMQGMAGALPPMPPANQGGPYPPPPQGGQQPPMGHPPVAGDAMGQPQMGVPQMNPTQPPGAPQQVPGVPQGVNPGAPGMHAPPPGVNPNYEQPPVAAAPPPAEAEPSLINFD